MRCSEEKSRASVSYKKVLQANNLYLQVMYVQWKTAFCSCKCSHEWEMLKQFISNCQCGNNARISCESELENEVTLHWLTVCDC